MKAKELTGQRFEKLLVIKRIESNHKGNAMWLCRCDCGKEITTPTYCLTGGHTKSCGCYSHGLFARQAAKHKGRKTKLYKHWCNMKTRCNNPKNEHYENYGGKGVKVCKEWSEDFSKFQQWALNNGYKEGLSIDRKDVNGNYEPSNCKWSTQTQQVRNRTNTVKVIYDGRLVSLGEVAEILGLNYKTLHARYKQGKPIAVGECGEMKE